MRIAIGLISATPFFIESAVQHRCSLVNFQIARKDVGPTALPDAAFASPGRFIGEMLHRLAGFYPHWSGLLAFNPSYELSAGHVQATITSVLQSVRDEPAAVVADSSGSPIAYYLRANAARVLPPVHFALLSALVASMDQLLLQESLDAAVPTITPRDLPPLGSPCANGFLLGSVNLRARLFAAGQAVQRLRLLDGAGKRDAIERGPRVAALGFHAGDVLFLCQALRAARPTAWKILVLECYRDIVGWVDPSRECISVDEGAPNRGGSIIDDEHLFLLQCIAKHREAQPQPEFWHFVRPYRDYAVTDFHLREAFRFSLGESCVERPEEFGYIPCETSRRIPQRAHPGRVVVHLDGGWKLKRYPPRDRPRLLALLRDKGFSPVILGSERDGIKGVPHAEYSTLDDFRALLGGSVALIGIDSFPAHFAAEYGVPTVHLFGSTWPNNSRYAPSAISAHVCRHLDCVPCRQTSMCILDGGTNCHAHGSPEDVLAALESLLVGKKAEDPALWDQRIPLPAGRRLTPAQRDTYLEDLFRRVEFEIVDDCPHCGDDRAEPIGVKFRLPMVRCSGCGLWFTRYRIRGEDLSILYGLEYWREFMALHGYPTGDARYDYDYRAAAERRDLLREFVSPGGWVLDIGCGLGALVRRLRESGVQACGMEMSETVRKRAELLSDIPIFSGFDDPRLGSLRFDAVSMFDVVEHVYQPRPFLREVASRLKPGGRIILETSRTDCKSAEELGVDHEDVKPIEHPCLYRTAHLEELLREVGCGLERVLYPEGGSQARILCVARSVEVPAVVETP